MMDRRGLLATPAGVLPSASPALAQATFAARAVIAAEGERLLIEAPAKSVVVLALAS